MDLRDFEYFSVIAEHGNLGRAAEALGLSQPALSKSLRRIEKYTNAKLVNRTPKGIELTPAGSLLASQLGHLRSSLSDVLRVVGDLSQGRAGHVRVGAGAGIASQLLPASVGILLEGLPQVTLNITVGTTESLVPALVSGELDLVISVVSTLYENVVQEHLMDDEMAIIASARHPLAKSAQVQIADLAQQKWALSAVNRHAWQWMYRAFEDQSLPLPKIAVVGPTSLRLPIIAASDLLGFCAKRMLPQYAQGLGLVQLQAQGLHWTRSVGLMYRKSKQLAPAVWQLIKILRFTASKLVKQRVGSSSR